jgi:hypothetical protein
MRGNVCFKLATDTAGKGISMAVLSALVLTPHLVTSLYFILSTGFKHADK